MNNLFPDKWEPVKFGDVVKEVKVSEKNPLENGLERFVGLEHLDSDDLKIKRWGLIKDGTSFTRKFVKGQILFGKRRAYQHKAALADFDGLCSGDIIVFDVKNDRLIPELLPFIVQSDKFFDYAVETSAGSLSPRTKWKFLSEYEFPLPSLEEQKRIAEILWAVENSIRKWEETEISIFRYKNILLNYIFNNVNKNKYKTLKEMCIKITDGSHYSPKAKIKGDYYIATVKDMGDRDINYVTCSYISKEDFDKLEKNSCRPLNGDVLLSKDGTVGKSFVYYEKRPLALLSSIAILRVNNKVLNNYYLKHFFETKLFRKQLIGSMSGTALKRIVLKAINVIKIPILPIKKQEAFADIFNLIDVNYFLIQKYLKNSKNSKKSFISNFF